MAAPFDDRRVRVQGVPAPVAQTRGPFAVAGAGLLVYAEPVPAQLAWVDRHGQEVQTLPIMGAIGAPRLSHDGGRVAITRMVEGAAAAGDIWVYDLARGQGTRLTTDPAHD